MNTFGDKIKEIRLSRDMSQDEFAKLLKTSKQVISRYETGQRSPKISDAKRYADILGVPLSTLADDIPLPNTDIYKFDNIFKIELKEFPMLGDIACGEPIFANEDRSTYVLAGADINADFCLTCKGDSMIGARIYDGDIVFIKKQPMVENGEIAAVIIDDEATLKRVYYYPESNKLVLNPENPNFHPLVYIGEELNRVRILGKAVSFNSLVR